MDVAPTPVLPGVWRLRGGGFVACAQVRDPEHHPGPRERPRYRTIFRAMRNAVDAREAFDWLADERRRVQHGVHAQTEVPTWKDFAVSLLERKVQAGDIQSASGVESIKGKLRRVIETATWASRPVDEVRFAHIQEWRDSLPGLTYDRMGPPQDRHRVVSRGHPYALRTLNGWLECSRVVWRAATAQFELPRNPMAGISEFNTKSHKPYSAEEPNSLNPRTEVAEFLSRFKERFPQWYAFVFTGFVLGQRPSTLRPLRRKGPSADLDLVKRKLYLRRSNSMGQEVMETTKTASELELSLPDALVEVLAAHVAVVEADPIMSKSDLLFPSPRTGKMVCRQILKVPFRTIMKDMGLNRNLSARAMRRTYQDMADEARLRAVTTMAVSGHKSLKMKHRYSSVHDDEIEAGIATIFRLATGSRKPSEGRS